MVFKHTATQKHPRTKFSTSKLGKHKERKNYFSQKCSLGMIPPVTEQEGHAK